MARSIPLRAVLFLKITAENIQTPRTGHPGRGEKKSNGNGLFV